MSDHFDLVVIGGGPGGYSAALYGASAGLNVALVEKDALDRWLARATGTVFIARKGAEALSQTRLFESRLRAGHRLLFFPEGTSTDGLRVLPFKTTLFAAFFADGLAGVTRIQPVSLLYRPPEGAEARFYGWWGTMEFGPHLLKTLGARRQGSVEVIFHAPLAVADFPDRKTLAAACERAVRAPFAEL